MTDRVEKILKQWKNERPDLDTSPMGIIGRVWRLERILTKSVQQILSKYDLNHGEFDVLCVLRRSGEPYSLTPSRLLRSLMLSSGALTNRIDRLEEAQMVMRSANPNDRRGVVVSLTTKGLAVINEAIESHVANEHILVEGISKQEQQQLAKLLKKLIVSLGNL